MGLFYPGVLVFDKNGRVGIILEEPVKKPLVGIVYKVLFPNGVEWVYPEEIELTEQKRLDRER